jgi:D-sedoheptulose 7-phosphate isomerase
MGYNISELFTSFPLLKEIEHQILNAYQIIRQAYEFDKTLFVCGNGGSASDAEHMVGELMKNFLLERKHSETFEKLVFSSYGNKGSKILDKLQPGFKAISLLSHPSFISAYSNDVDSEYIFAQQLFVLASSSDVLVVFSTSGNSKNVYRALQIAEILGLKTILITGANGGKCAQIANCSIKVPVNETFRIQEYHLPIYHSLCAMLEEHFYGVK